MPECLIINRQTDRQTDTIILSFYHVYLYIVPLNTGPPGAGISRKAVMPFLGFPFLAVFLNLYIYRDKNKGGACICVT